MKNALAFFRSKSLLVVLILMSNKLLAQDLRQDSVKLRTYKNAIYGSVGSILGFTYDANIYYERMFRNNSAKSKASPFVKTGFGGWSSPYGGKGSYILGQFGILTGAQKHHFEASAGLIKFLFGDNEKIETKWSASLGYRVQRPDGRYIFRTGVGWPEALYIGFGGRF